MSKVQFCQSDRKEIEKILVVAIFTDKIQITCFRALAVSFNIMSEDKSEEVDVMFGLKTVLSQIETAVARRGKVSLFYLLLLIVLLKPIKLFVTYHIPLLFCYLNKYIIY